jgi:hypothetical protein
VTGRRLAETGIFEPRGIKWPVSASYTWAAVLGDFLVNHFSLRRVYTIEYLVAALVEPPVSEREP